MTSLIHGLQKEMIQMNLQDKRLTDLEDKHACQREVIVQEFGKVMHILLHLKWIINKDLLYSTWNSTQCHVPAWMEEGFGGEWIHAHVWLSPFTVPFT